MPLSLQPASGLDKQETLSVISPLFACLNERQAKDREGTNTTVRPHPDPTVNTLITAQETEREGEPEGEDEDSWGNTTESKRGSEILSTSWWDTHNITAVVSMVYNLRISDP